MMLDPLTLGVAATSALVLAGATWLSMPRPPTLDGERWFKTWLITLLRGRVEATGGQADDWSTAVVRFVPWHPAGRFPEAKVLDPSAAPPPPALEGELQLLEALAKLPTAQERWSRMYDEDEEGRALRLEDPFTLGEAYNPARWLGHEVSWDAVADGKADKRLLQRTEATWLLIGERWHPDLPDVEGALLELLGDRAERYDPSAKIKTHPQAMALGKDIAKRRDEAFTARVLHLLGWIFERAPDHANHVVLVGVGGEVPLLLEALRTSNFLRDQTDAVLSLGGVIQGLDDAEGELSWSVCTDWMQANFRHQILDLEASHRTPYMSLQWLDRHAEPPGAAGLPVARARFPEPPMRGVRRESIQLVDLGVLPVDPDFPSELAARALWGMTTAWLVARDG